MDAPRFPSHIPVLIGSLPYDNLSALGDITKMIGHLQSFGAQVQHHICSGQDTKLMHGKIGKTKSWQETVKKFSLTHTSAPTSEA